MQYSLRTFPLSQIPHSDVPNDVTQLVLTSPMKDESARLFNSSRTRCVTNIFVYSIYTALTFYLFIYIQKKKP